MIARSSWLSHGALCRPSTPEYSKVEHSLWHSCYTRPFSHGLGFAAPLYQAIRSSVVCLFSLGGPAYVTRFVVAVVVNALKRVSGRWPAPHVIQKRLEGSSPLLTDGNSTCPVSEVAIVPFFVASMVHCCPDRIFGCSCKSVLGVLPNHPLVMKTAARTGAAIFKAATSDHLTASTVALAKPHRSLSVIGLSRHYSQPTISMPGSVNQSTHKHTFYSTIHHITTWRAA